MLDRKQCDAPESKSDKAGIEYTNMLPVTTLSDAFASSVVKLYA